MAEQIHFGKECFKIKKQSPFLSYMEYHVFHVPVAVVVYSKEGCILRAQEDNSIPFYSLPMDETFLSSFNREDLF
jgi:hypothetical protein